MCFNTPSSIINVESKYYQSIINYGLKATHRCGLKIGSVNFFVQIPKDCDGSIDAKLVQFFSENYKPFSTHHPIDESLISEMFNRFWCPIETKILGHYRLLLSLPAVQENARCLDKFHQTNTCPERKKQVLRTALSITSSLIPADPSNNILYDVFCQSVTFNGSKTALSTLWLNGEKWSMKIQTEEAGVQTYSVTHEGTCDDRLTKLPPIGDISERLLMAAKSPCHKLRIENCNAQWEAFFKPPHIL